MDINLPGIDGLQATKRIVAGRPQARVLLMSTYRVEDLPADAAHVAQGVRAQGGSQPSAATRVR